MKILLDTCILAELRNPNRGHSIRKFLDPFEDDDLFLSVLTVGEIAKGISLLPDSKKKQELETWLNGLEHQFTDRILPLNRDVSLMWGELTARAQKKGVIIPACDGLIAATALYYGLHIMTRNTRHFKESGALIIDPVKEQN